MPQQAFRFTGAVVLAAPTARRRLYSTVAHFGEAYALARRNQPSSVHGCVSKSLNSKNLSPNPENGGFQRKYALSASAGAPFRRNLGENIKKSQN
ncbi:MULTISPECIES: hypothetical protein [Rhizobium]|uniref:Uncharacterized protein n=2 Tax=Rhizobium TaxID=379 RepID=B3PQX8_RHIE6|nr:MULTISPECIES: hypothetical protein [Rhizobium]ACE91551.1 hypothetical protein RHECIAT_CH0002599 [Rhizobium etli CIAT 652]MDE8762120.1 hypothetical protein [Rhizobium sp. CBK13]NKF13664.1 hypothetical protein [Rhizobium phaseoli]QPK10242.1 hypothetical protein HER27_006715 [Rhizobium phaseoli]